MSTNKPVMDRLVMDQSDRFSPSTVVESLVFSTWDPDRPPPHPDAALIALAQSPPLVMTASTSSSSASASTADNLLFQSLDYDDTNSNSPRHNVSSSINNNRRRHHSAALTSPAIIQRLHQSADASIHNQNDKDEQSNNDDEHSNTQRQHAAQDTRTRHTDHIMSSPRPFERSSSSVPYYQPGPVMRRTAPRTLNQTLDQLHQDDSNNDELTRMKSFVEKLRRAETEQSSHVGDPDEADDNSYIHEEKKEHDRDYRKGNLLRSPPPTARSHVVVLQRPALEYSVIQDRENNDRTRQQYESNLAMERQHATRIQSDGAQLRQQPRSPEDAPQPVPQRKVEPVQPKTSIGTRNHDHTQPQTLQRVDSYHSYQSYQSERTQDLLRRAENLAITPKNRQAVLHSPKTLGSPPHLQSIQATPRHSNKRHDQSMPDYSSTRASPIVMELLAGLKLSTRDQAAPASPTSTISTQPQQFSSHLSPSSTIEDVAPRHSPPSSPLALSASQGPAPYWSSYPIHPLNHATQINGDNNDDENRNSWRASNDQHDLLNDFHGTPHGQVEPERTAHSTVRDRAPVSMEATATNSHTLQGRGRPPTIQSEARRKKRRSIPPGHTYEQVSSDLTGCKDGLPKFIWKLFRDCAEIDDSASDASAEFYADESAFKGESLASGHTGEETHPSRDDGRFDSSNRRNQTAKHSIQSSRVLHDTTRKEKLDDTRPRYLSDQAKTRDGGGNNDDDFASCAKDCAVALKDLLLPRGREKLSPGNSPVLDDRTMTATPLSLQEDSSIVDRGNDSFGPGIPPFGMTESQLSHPAAPLTMEKCSDDRVMDEKAFFSTATTRGFHLYLHSHRGRPPLKTPGRVTVCLRLGRASATSDTFVQPTLVWMDDEGDQFGSVNLFDIRSLDKAVPSQLKEFPLVDLERSIVLLTERSSYVFDAPTRDAADSFIRGIRLMIAKLAFSLVTGDVGSSCDVLDMGSQDMSIQGKTQAMNDLVNELVATARHFVRTS